MTGGTLEAQKVNIQPVQVRVHNPALCPFSSPVYDRLILPYWRQSPYYRLEFQILSNDIENSFDTGRSYTNLLDVARIHLFGYLQNLGRSISIVTC